MKIQILKFQLQIMKYSTFIFLLIAITFSSCVTNKKLTYLQYNGDRNDAMQPPAPSDYKIMPFDNLFIKVVTPDPLLSAMFNSMPVTSVSTSVTEQSVDLISYPVDSDGYIQIPYAGKIMVAGKTIDMITTEIEKVLQNYVADASITVRMVNNYVSLLGEVQRPGRYPIYKDRLNIFQALAMAGDLTDFSDRQKIQLIRQRPEGNSVKEFTLTDRSIMTSEFFYVMPNDVIYAQPVKGKFFQMNAFPYTVILSSITTFVLLWNVLR